MRLQHRPFCPYFPAISLTVFRGKMTGSASHYWTRVSSKMLAIME